MNKTKWICFYIIFLMMLSCNSNIEKPATSFYHWKSYYEISNTENEYLEKLKVQKLYLRYFDVDFVNGQVEPIGKIVVKNDFKYQHEIIPTIFITNKTFKNIGNKKIDDLIVKIIQLINNTHQKITEKTIQEVQFDCDWTNSTREKYFLFLQKIKEKSNWNISATIRLHQVKYKGKTGVPPVDKFVLMCYNTGEVKNIAESNSILNPKIVEQYTTGMSDYPERLEVALPLFSWGVLFRERQLIKLIRNIDTFTFEDNKKYKLEGNSVRILESTYLNGYYLYEGDEIRLETVTRETLESTSKILREHLKPKEIIYYHLDQSIIKKTDNETLESINDLFIGG